MKAARCAGSLLVMLCLSAAAEANSLGFDGAAAPAGDATPSGESYLLVEHHGGSYSDAEKDPLRSEDDRMCWAAATANVLMWTGWGFVDGIADADDAFRYFQDHWTNEGGIMSYGWDWWLDGTNDSQGDDGWAQVDVPGGGFFPAESFALLFQQDWTPANAMRRIDEYLRAGCGVGIGVYLGDAGGHAVTVWGVNYLPGSPTEYVGIWVTDSDDDKSQTDAPDSLRYYEVALYGGQWYLQDFYGRSGHSDTATYHIGGVQALAQRVGFLAPVVPEPVTLLTALTGLSLLGGYVRKRRAA
jgi:hypothetical protein